MKDQHQSDSEHFRSKIEKLEANILELEETIKEYQCELGKLNDNLIKTRKKRQKTPDMVAPTTTASMDGTSAADATLAKEISVSTVHEGQKFHKCKKCGKKFYGEKLFVYHLNQVHNQKNEKTEIPENPFDVECNNKIEIKSEIKIESSE